MPRNRHALCLWLSFALLLAGCSGAAANGEDSQAPAVVKDDIVRILERQQLLDQRGLRTPETTAAEAEERERIAAAATSAAGAQLQAWTNLPCPTTGSVTQAFFDPQPNDGSQPLDVEPPDTWQGYEIVRVADLALPAGIMLESDGNWLGDGGEPVRIAEPGTYPFFMAISVHETYRVPALGQLVFDPSSEPVRWVEDERLGFGTDGGTGWLGSPASAHTLAPNASEIDHQAWSLVGDTLNEIYRTDDEFCTIWERDDGSNFVHYSNGWGDGFFPAAAGYDAAGNLVAVTWFYGSGSWVLAGIPGVPPRPVQEQYAAN